MKTALMPDRAEIIKRLASVNDTNWNIERFYPLIAVAAGTERVGFGWLRALVDDPQVLAEALDAFHMLHPGLADA